MKLLIFVLFVAGILPASAQLSAPPYPLDPSYTATYIYSASVIQRGMNDGYIPWNNQSAQTLGFLHGIIESNAEFFGSPDFDGPIDPPYYDDIPYDASSYYTYVTLSNGYATEGYAAGQYGQAWLYDSGFYLAMSLAIAYHFGL